MTAARRPDLVAQTMASFAKRVFSTMPISTFYLNIDPVWGSEQEADEVEALIRRYAASVVVRRPTEASFGGAVKWLWSQPRTQLFLHMEDDWIMNAAVSPSRVAKQFATPDVTQVRLENWNRLRRRRRPPTFTTSPSFVRSSFGHLAAGYMNGSLDPEKQFRNGLNLALQDAASRFRAEYYGTSLTRRMATDIGRDWRASRGIDKKIIDGTSVWTSP